MPQSHCIFKCYLNSIRMKSLSIWINFRRNVLQNYAGLAKNLRNVEKQITISRRRLPASEYHYPIELLLFFTHRETLILAGLSVICYIVTAVVNPTVVHR